MNPAFSSLLAALARELDLPGIETRDGDPSCLLGIDDFEVSLRCLSADQVMIFTVVAPLPARKRDELYAALLDANTFFHQTQGFTLAAREDTGVTLQGTLPWPRSPTPMWAPGWAISSTWPPTGRNAAWPVTPLPMPRKRPPWIRP